MTDEILKEIAKTSDRIKVFGLLQKMSGKLTHVQFRSASAKGEFWVEKGQRIFRASSDGDGDNGMLAMMQLLAAQNISFNVMPTPVEKPKSNVDFKLAELVIDEAGIIQQIKDVLWPVEQQSESDVLTEASIAPIPVGVLEQTYEKTTKRALEEESFVETETAITPPFAQALTVPDSVPVVVAEAVPEQVHEPPKAAQSTEEELNVLEQLVLDAAAKQEADAAKAADEGKPETKTYSSTSAPIVIEETQDQDKLTHKRRAEMRALEVWTAEEPEKFFEENAVNEDDLFAQRRAEMTALNSMLEAHANLSREIFTHADPVIPDNEKEKRRKEFEILREYFAENPDRFYEYVSLGESDPNGTEELRTKILGLMSQQADPEAFAQVDGRVQDESVLKHVWTPEPEPIAEPEPELEAKPEDEYVPPDLVPSPFGEVTSNLNYDEKHRGKLDVGTSPDDTSLIKRDPKKDNKFGFIDREKLRYVEKVPKQVLIAGAIFAAFMPVFGLYLYHYFNQNAEADYEDQRAASQLAAKAAQEESTSRKSEEPFRMPEAGPVNVRPPSGRGQENSRDATGASVTEAELNSYKWTPPDHPAPQPSAAQLAKAQRCLAQGEQALALGRPEEAARVFADGLLDCPNYPSLRIRLARAYIQIRDYEAAKDVLLGGMKSAQSQGEFDQYLAILRELPRAQ